MDFREHHIDISFRARYYTYGQFGSETKTVWFVMHGYGQLAKFFIRKFETLNPHSNYVIAPEGLSRFYLQGFKGRVGATWMTKENRLADIKNYLSFLNNLYEQTLKEEDNPTINILGFSQGAATACRWIADGNIAYNKLILWAGIFPPDLQIDAARNSFHGKKVSLVIGDQDEYLNQERITEMDQISKQLNVSPEIIHYSGGHTIDADALKKIAGEG